MKRRKAALALLLAVSLLLGSTSMFAEGLHETTPEGAYDLTVPEGLERYYQKYDPPIQLTQNQTGPEDETLFYPGDSWTSNQFTEWALNVAGIEWSAKWPAPDDETAQQKLTLGMATGDLPDVIKADAMTIKQLSESGAIIPVKELFDEYASPLGKELYAQYAEANDDSTFWPVTIDGEIMALVTMADMVGPSNIWYRVDELDALGLGIPSTLEELEAAFAAYKEKYPENHCLALNKDLYNTANVFGAHGAYREIWLEQGDQLVYSSVQPEVKDALNTLRSWYEKGYIDREFVVKNGDKVNEEFVAGKILALEEAWHVIWGTAPNTLKNLPDAVLNAGPILEGRDGKAGSVQNAAQNSYYAISAACENPEAVIIQFNWLIDSALRNYDELREKVEFVYPKEMRKNPINNETLIAEGKDITFQVSDYAKPGPGTASTWFWNRGNNRIFYGFDIGQTVGELSGEMKRVAELVAAGGATEDPEEQILLDIYKTYFSGFDMLKVNGGNNAAYLAGTYADGLAKIDAFQGLPTRTMSEKKAYLDKLELETFTKIITGEAELDAFDEFVTQWQSNGGSEITEEVNDWYDGVK